MRRLSPFWVLPAVLLTLSACTTLPSVLPRQVSGEIETAEELVLPKQSKLVVELVDASQPARVLARKAFRPETKGLVIPFDLSVSANTPWPEQGVQVQAHVEDSRERVRWQTIQPVALSESGLHRALRLTPVAVAELYKEWHYRCENGFEFSTRANQKTQTISLPTLSQPLELESVTVGSGFEYRAEGLNLRGKGREASLQWQGKTLQCEASPAEWSNATWGRSFRAIGHDPEWALTINRQSDGFTLDLVSKRKRERLEADEFERSNTGKQVAIYGSGVVVELEQRACRDVLSGLSFDTGVTVTRSDGTVLEGCGRKSR